MDSNEGSERKHYNIADVFSEEKCKPPGYLRVSAPMVRYTKYEFRKLLRQNGVKLCFTPMIIADSFNRSQKARENEFTTSSDEGPLIAQFAACNSYEFVKASQLIYPFVDGVDLNAGCPQSWAIKKGYGCGLLRKPEIIHDIVRNVRRILPNDFSVSIKMRLLSKHSVKSTVEFARQMEKCGINFITIHGRTMWEKSSNPLNIDAMADIKQSLQSTFLIVNGNVRSWEDANNLHSTTKGDGIMAARGLLSNPTVFNAMYKDYNRTPMECMQEWLDIGIMAHNNISFQCFHHHLTFMCSSYMKSCMRNEFNNFTEKAQIYGFFKEHFNLEPSVEALHKRLRYTNCNYSSTNIKSEEFKEADQPYLKTKSNGKFFEEFNTNLYNYDENDDIDLGSSFIYALDV